MNTQENINRRFVITLSILLAALWLPLTTFAQSANTPAADCALGEISVGFGETDPADKLSQDVMAFSSVPDYQSQQEYAGFAETDPASGPFRGAVKSLHVSTLKVSNGSAGFAETDPSVVAPLSSEVIYPWVVSCLGKNGGGLSLL